MFNLAYVEIKWLAKGWGCVVRDSVFPNCRLIVGGDGL